MKRAIVIILCSLIVAAAQAGERKAVPGDIESNAPKLERSLDLVVYGISHRNNYDKPYKRYNPGAALQINVQHPSSNVGYTFNVGKWYDGNAERREHLFVGSYYKAESNHFNAYAGFHVGVVKETHKDNTAGRVVGYPYVGVGYKGVKLEVAAVPKATAAYLRFSLGKF